MSDAHDCAKMEEDLAYVRHERDSALARVASLEETLLSILRVCESRNIGPVATLASCAGDDVVDRVRRLAEAERISQEQSQRSGERCLALIAERASLKAVLGEALHLLMTGYDVAAEALDVEHWRYDYVPRTRSFIERAQKFVKENAATRADEQAGDGARREASCQTERLTYNPMTVCPTCLCAYRDLRWNSGCDLEGRIYRGRRMDAAIVECPDLWHDSPRPDASAGREGV